MVAQLERRILPASQTELHLARGTRDGGKRGGNTLIGYAAVYNSLSCDLGGFRETIRPGAFQHCLESSPDVRALINHNPDLLIGRTRSRTLRLYDASKGLRVECDLPDTSYARDYAACVDRQEECGQHQIAGAAAKTAETPVEGRGTALPTPTMARVFRPCADRRPATSGLFSVPNFSVGNRRPSDPTKKSGTENSSCRVSDSIVVHQIVKERRPASGRRRRRATVY